MDLFDEIYERNLWGFGSGHGSLSRYTKSYRQFLEMFMRENNIASVVDYGCGDWQFSRQIDWGNAKYLGLDIVGRVIEKNQRLHRNQSVDFSLIKPGESDIPRADLLLAKDVMQHWSEEEIRRFIGGVVPRYKYALITNCILPEASVNQPIANGGFRPLDIRRNPYNVKATVVHAFAGPRILSWSKRKHFPAWKKLVMLISN